MKSVEVIHTAKRALRSDLKSRLEGLSKELKRIESEAITNKILNNVKFQEAKTVCGEFLGSVNSFKGFKPPY